jgi:hypothetical protein
MLNKQLTKEEAQWLINDFAPRRGGIVNGKSMGKYFVPARSLMQGSPSSAPECGCHYLAYAKMTASMYGQYLSEIEHIANEEQQTKRGRPKKSS